MRIHFFIISLFISNVVFAQLAESNRASEWQIRYEVPIIIGNYTQGTGLGVVGTYYFSNNFGVNIGKSRIRQDTESSFGYYGIITTHTSPWVLGMTKRWAVSRSIFEPVLTINWRIGKDYGVSKECVLGGELNWTKRFATYYFFGVSFQDAESRFLANTGIRYSFGFH